MPTKIQWTQETWNPVVGCSKVSEGCRICYAIREAHRMAGNPNQKIASVYKGLTKRTGRAPANWTGVVKFLPERLEEPLRWRNPRMVFVDSMSDLFHERLTITQITDVFTVMARCPQHTFQVLTKRAERAMSLWRDIGTGVAYRLGKQDVEGFWPLSNVWMGVSVENQEAADERIPLLLRMPATVRFLSCEPLLGSIDLRFVYEDPHTSRVYPLDPDRKGIHWVIVGGESGPNSRPMHPRWVKEIKFQCQLAGVPFFFKQWGDWAPSLMEGRAEFTIVGYDGTMHGWGSDWEMRGVIEKVNGRLMRRVGKGRAGRVYEDGRTYDEMPLVEVSDAA